VAKREMLVLSAVVVVEDRGSLGRGDDPGDEVVMDKDLDGSETSGDKEWSCRTPRETWT
jgi:hypothetical protein